MRFSFILGLSAVLASLPAAAEPQPEDLLVPAVYAGLSFGGAGGAREPLLGLRLDAARIPATVGAPALMQWELRPGRSELAVAGLPVLAFSGVAATGEGDGAQPGGASRIVGASLLGTAALIGVAGWAVGQIFEGFGDDVGQAMAEEMFAAGSEGGSGDEPPCSGVEVADNCVGGD